MLKPTSCLGAEPPAPQSLIKPTGRVVGDKGNNIYIYIYMRIYNTGIMQGLCSLMPYEAPEGKSPLLLKPTLPNLHA